MQPLQKLNKQRMMKALKWSPVAKQARKGAQVKEAGEVKQNLAYPQICRNLNNFLALEVNF